MRIPCFFATAHVASPPSVGGDKGEGEEEESSFLYGEGRADMKKSLKTYEKPRIDRVKLIMEEAVLQACKTADTAPAMKNKYCGFPGCKTEIGS